MVKRKLYAPATCSIFFATSAALFTCTGQSATTAKDAISIAWEAAPRSFDPRYAADADSQYLENLMHCSIVTFDADGKAVGDLAEKWSWKDNKTLVVTLKSGVTFSDGTPVSANDVKTTYEFFQRKDVTPISPRATAFSSVQTVSAPDAKTVIFALKDPDATFASNLVVGILPEKTAKESAILTAEKPSVGCGPFILKSSDVTGIVLERNAKYTGGKAAKISRLEIKVVKDEATRFAKLRKGEIDLVQNLLGRDKVTQLSKSAPDLRVMRRPGLNTAYIGFNMKDPVLAKAEVRRAIALAINRELIIKHVLAGLAIPATTMIPPSDSFYDKSLKPAAYDPKEAMKLLDTAGLKDPDGAGPQPRLTLTYKTTTNDTRIQVAKAIAAMLKDVGIQVNVQSLEWGKFKDDVEKGQVQLWSLNWIGFKDPDIYRFAFGTESFPPNGGNRGWYSNPELDKLLKEGHVTTDEAARKQIYAKVQQLVQNEMPYIFLWHEEVFAVANKSIKDFELFADGRFTSMKTAFKE